MMANLSVRYSRIGLTLALVGAVLLVNSGLRAQEVGSVVTIPQVAKTNELLAKSWKDNDITPSDRCSDYEFIRRVTLDIIGRIPTPAEIDKFMKDAPQSRRGNLIDRLLDSEEYVDNWATLWTTWLLTRSAQGLYRDQMQVWLAEQLSQVELTEDGTIQKKKQLTGWDETVYKLLTATGSNNENGAVNYILQHLGEPTPAPKVNEEGRFNFVPITARTTRLFLGLQVQCTQCHDHPFNPEWKQYHFWGMNTFFRQVDRTGNINMRNNNRMNQAPILGLTDNTSLNPKNMILFENRKAVVLAQRAKFLRGQKYDASSGKTRREMLAELITKDPYFAKAYVNRMWAHFFGRGMTANGKDIDDFGEHNEVLHPELLEYLAAEFRKDNHDPRDLVRWICNSDAYSLSSTANETNDKLDAEPFFSRMLLKSMSPEQLFESLWVSTYAFNKPIDAADNARKDLRDRWMGQMVTSFGDDEGNESTFNGTVIQALMLMNGNDINGAINSKDGPVDHAMKKGSMNAVMDELFLITLARKPTDAERRQIMDDVKPVLIRGKPLDRAYWEKVSQDLFWALLNSSEFILNH
ncbi:MAG: DUF1549 domain-containing protein [Gemmataceae bacterium]